MTLAEKLPQMTDDALAVLADNARRLAQADRGPDHAAAQALLPLIEAELTNRRVIKLQSLREAAASRPSPAKKRAAKRAV